MDKHYVNYDILLELDTGPDEVEGYLYVGHNPKVKWPELAMLLVDPAGAFLSAPMNSSQAGDFTVAYTEDSGERMVEVFPA